MYENYNHLGFYNRYYIRNPEIRSFVSFNSVLSEMEQKIIDPVALIEIISKSYCFGDRTLVKGLYRSPWLAKPSSDSNKWDYFDLPSHENNVFEENVIANQLYGLLSEEVAGFCSGKKNIGLLLSGGMDSRITAGVLHNLIKEGVIDAKVLAITWGMENSRDIVYAKEIATRFNWQWQHIELSSDNLLYNLDFCSEMGCEALPIHLHSISLIKELKGIDVILASSFGDSIGRGVFSSRHITNLKSISSYLKNRFFLIKDRCFKQYTPYAKMDLDSYRSQYPKEELNHVLEVEQLSNYMRRMLNPCIGLIDVNIPVYQTFSSPSVYGYMWSLSPSCRNDNIYSIILDNFIQELKDIPWSKTGIKYNTSNDVPDNYSQDYHRYHQWINNELFDYLYNTLQECDIDSLQIFNKKTLYRAIYANKRLDTNRVTPIDGIFTWLVAFFKMMKKFNLKINEEASSSSFRDKFSPFVVGPYVSLFEKGLELSKKIR